jgi:class 3 adenylate cyclase
VDAVATPATPSSHSERRQLTVMFCDLVGSTALSTRLDPEELQDLIRAFQDRCAGAITRFDGFIARYMGDGMLVYFGFPRAHEDDPGRAVLAGLAIVAAIADLNRDLRAKNDVDLSVRVGIATGQVVVGDIVGEGAAAESTVVGETPNLAARLQGIAQPNQVVISSNTHGLLGCQFECEDLGAQSLKGLSASVTAWRVVAEKDLDAETVADVSAGAMPLVGRQEELGLLMRAWETSRNGHGQVVLINGEPGIGKSRLLDALRARVQDDDYLWVAMRCSPYHRQTALHPVIGQLERALH